MFVGFLLWGFLLFGTVRASFFETMCGCAQQQCASVATVCPPPPPCPAAPPCYSGSLQYSGIPSYSQYSNFLRPALPSAPSAPYGPSYGAAAPAYNSPTSYGSPPAPSYLRVSPPSSQTVAPPAIPEFPVYSETPSDSGPQSNAQSVTPSRLDVEYQPVSPLSGYGEQSPVASTYRPPPRDNEDADYLSTSEDDPIARLSGVKTVTTTDWSRCNNEELRQLMEENIGESPTVAKRRIQKATSERFDSTFAVVCSQHNFSYLASTQMFCEVRVNDIVCFAFVHKV